MKNILVTGSAGFIGANLVKRLFTEMCEGTIVGLDNLNNYYDVSLKEYRLKELETLYSSLIEGSTTSSRAQSPLIAGLTRNLNYKFVKGSIADKELVDKLFAEYKFDVVVNLAAQAGVRYSIDNPDVYIESNIIGFYNILEACRHSKDLVAGEDTPHCGLDPQSQPYQGVQHLVYASSSSVYGGNKRVPFSTDDRVDNPVSLYAATKKSNELMAHCYSKLYNIPSTGLRFFTVYGPAGRPDMAYFGFTPKITLREGLRKFAEWYKEYYG